MVTYVSGDIFSSPAQVLTNPVNTVGVMGKGLALEFKNRFPGLFEDYSRRCGEGRVIHGQPYLWEDDHHQVLNFPTKRDWRDPSRLEDINAGLTYLAGRYQELGIHSIAMPALGSGLGGLNWSDVRQLIDRHLGALADLEVYVYEPAQAVEREDSTGSKTSPSSDPHNIAAKDISV